MSLSSLEQTLEGFREQSQTKVQQGALFEHLVVEYLKHDKAQRGYYQNAWSYRDWASEQGIGRADRGIDVVAAVREEHGGGYCAVQCKFHSDNSNDCKKCDIDSFIAESSREQFTERLFVDTTKKPWGANAEKAIEGLTPPCRRIDIHELEQSSIDWSVYQVRQIIKHSPDKTIRPHQALAIDSVMQGLAEEERGKLIMACGTGKTYTSLKIAERMVGVGGYVLYLVPSLALMSQTLREWNHDSELSIHAIAACSDSRMGKTYEGDDPFELKTP